MSEYNTFEKAGFSNTRFTLLVGISIFTIFDPIGVFGQTGQPVDPSSYGMTPGRLGANVAALLGLVGVVIGVLALVRPAGRFGTATGRLGATISLSTGLIGIIIAGLVAAISGGRVGTGGGLLGAIVALVLGLIATALGGFAFARSRRAA